MGFNKLFPWLVVTLIVARWTAQLWLDWLNRRQVLAHADAMPEAFRSFIDEPTYAKSVQYTLAKLRLNNVQTTCDTVVLLAALLSGVLP